MTTHELTATIRELKELKQMQEELAAEIAAAEDTIKAHMTAAATDELSVSGYKVRWKPVASNRFDTAAFKATHPALYGQYVKTTEYRRFTVA